jgi:hypothetical protein
LHFHKSFHSYQKSFVTYRNYSGYNLSVGLHKYFGNNLDKYRIFMGFLVGTSYDKFHYINQYMLYPTIETRLGVELLSNCENIFFPIRCYMPIVYSFREAGSYLQLGIALSIGIQL